MKIKEGYLYFLAFELGVEDFMVDVVVKETEFEAWIYRESYGVKNLMFGTKHKSNIGGVEVAEFSDLAEKNAPNFMQVYDLRYKEE